MNELSIIIPAKNEAVGLRGLLPRLRETCPEAEIVVVNDGSTDATAQVCEQHGVVLVSHPYGIGNGGAIKSGARRATGERLLFMDADGQHDPADIPGLLETMEQGYDMVVGARTDETQASRGRFVANRLFNRLASWQVGQRIDDLTSGFRLVDAIKFRRFLYLLPNGFSYPTTITMAFFRSGYTVAYRRIEAREREGSSHIRPLRDGMRFLLIIFKVGALYSPMRLFLPVSLIFFATGVSYYLYTFITAHRFTNMSALLFINAVLVFLIGLVSEQISALHYKHSDE